MFETAHGLTWTGQVSTRKFKVTVVKWSCEHQVTIADGSVQVRALIILVVLFCLQRLAPFMHETPPRIQSSQRAM
jgi:hypothetical protein